MKSFPTQIETFNFFHNVDFFIYSEWEQMIRPFRRKGEFNFWFQRPKINCTYFGTYMFQKMNMIKLKKYLIPDIKMQWYFLCKHNALKQKNSVCTDKYGCKDWNQQGLKKVKNLRSTCLFGGTSFNEISKNLNFNLGGLSNITSAHF